MERLSGEVYEYTGTGAVIYRVERFGEAEAVLETKCGKQYLLGSGCCDSTE